MTILLRILFDWIFPTQISVWLSVWTRSSIIIDQHSNLSRVSAKSKLETNNCERFWNVRTVRTSIYSRQLSETKTCTASVWTLTIPGINPKRLVFLQDLVIRILFKVYLDLLLLIYTHCKWLGMLLLATVAQDISGGLSFFFLFWFPTCALTSWTDLVICYTRGRHFYVRFPFILFV